ncbi:MAG: radical SAM protein, partial [bacterium]
MLENISLAISSVCGAQCIFCPSHMGKNVLPNTMPYETVEKIAAEISSEKFKQFHLIKKIHIGEIGDCFLNNDIIRILRLFKSRVPDIHINAYTNFHHFTPDKTDIILQEKLIDSVACDIDGSNKENYFNVKKLSLPKTVD